MQNIKDFKEESLKILDEKIYYVVDEIEELFDSILTKEVLESLGYTTKVLSLFGLIKEINAHCDLAKEDIKLAVDKLNRKSKEYIDLLRKEILIKIKYKEIAKWVNSEEENCYDIFFLRKPNEDDIFILENIDIILYDLNSLNFEILLSSEQFGSIDNIEYKLIDIYRKYPNISSDKIVQKLRKRK